MIDLTESDPAYRLITEPEELEAIIPDLMRETVLGMDIEADSMYHFAEQICLVQIATESECLVIDPLAIKDLSPLRPLFQDPAITKIFHGASYDVRCLGMCYDIRINNLFDTEIACRILGMNETGLNAVLQQTFKVTLDKKYQKKDWSRRPLSGGMLAYAARDVLYLIPLWRHLSGELEKLRRTAWAEEECRLISAARPAPENGQPLFKKVKGAGRLDRRSLAVLESLLKKRLDIARKKDLPPFKVFNPTTLLRLAEEKPANQNALRRSKILSDKQMSMYGESVCRAIKKALEIKDHDLPFYPREKRKPLSRKAALRLNALKQWREETAESLKIDAGLILPNALASRVARENPQTRQALDNIDELKEWQKKTFGEEIIKVLGPASQEF